MAPVLTIVNFGVYMRKHGREAMTRGWKIGGFALAALVATAGLGGLYIELAGIPRYPVERIALRVEATPERIDRGRKLVSLLCVGCHLDAKTGRLTGHHMVDVPAKFGAVYSANITRDRANGIGAWTAGEIAYLLRTGVARDGRYIPPWMIKLPHLAESDMQAIIAFLQSDDPLVAPVDVAPRGVSEPSFLTKLLCTFVFKKLPYPRRRIATPPLSDKVAYGRYVVTGLDCYGCHSASWETMNIADPERSAGYLGGGNILNGVDGRPIRSANLTADDETGIGTWSESDFLRALRLGLRPDGTPLRPPMLPMPQLSDDEVAAVYAYLRTVPRIRNPALRPSLR